MPSHLTYPDPPPGDGHITLRAWQPRDLPVVAEASADPYIVATTSVPARWSNEAGRDWIARQRQRLADGAGYALCVADVVSDQALGFVGLWLRNLDLGRADIGYWVVPTRRRAGVATAALRLVSRWAFATLPVARLELAIEPANIASQRVAEAAGYRLEGLLRGYIALAGARRDALLYARLADDPATD